MSSGLRRLAPFLGRALVATANTFQMIAKCSVKLTEHYQLVIREKDTLIGINHCHLSAKNREHIIAFFLHKPMCLSEIMSAMASLTRRVIMVAT